MRVSLTPASSGSAMVQLGGFHARALTAQPSGAQQQQPQLLYATEWRELELPGGSGPLTAASSEASLLVLGGPLGLPRGP